MGYAKPHWDANAGQWAQLIGYTINKRGVRVRRRFYFGADETAAIQESKQKQVEWNAIVEATRPVWEQKITASLVTPSRLPIKDALTQFLTRKEEQVGLAGGRGIKPSTYNGLKTTLNLAIRHNSIDTSKELSALDKPTLVSYVNYWMKLPDGICTRTAINYCTSFKAFLDFCHDNGIWAKPTGTDSLFSFRAMKQPNVQKVSTDTLKKLLNAAATTPKTLLYIMLALNGGMYQSDISDLRRDELIEEDGEHFIIRKRTKLKGVDESADDESGMVRTYLFPETVAILKRFAEKDGSHLIRNAHGGPLWEEKVGETRRDAISPAYERVATAASVSFSFRQLRKVGWNAMKRIGGSDDVARKWAGQRVQGISRAYNLDEYGDVTKALKQWHKELVKAKVIPAVG